MCCSGERILTLSPGSSEEGGHLAASSLFELGLKDAPYNGDPGLIDLSF